ncbi:MAG TPA: TonB family protein [Candidatus Acidoferrales bacterium]|nr:TonB family protein [Candidatus Acidoferrales bacterium]
MSNEPQRARAGVFSHERRRFARRRLNSLAYIDLGNDSGGIVLNISEGGLAVHSAVTLNARFLPSIRFQLPHSSEWVAARGELTWIDASRKQAGLRFGALSDPARSQIRNWISSSSDDAGNPDEVALGETMQLASITLGTIPVPRKPLPFTEVDGVREIESSREVESIDRKLRVHFARRDPAPERKSRSDGAMWWSFIAAIGVLAILSFGFGWMTGHGKMSVISAAVANVRAHIVAHAQNRSALAATAPSGSSATAAPAGEQLRNSTNVPAAAVPLTNSTGDPPGAAPAVPALPRVMVTTQSYVPVPNGAQGKPERVQELVLGQIVQHIDPTYPAQAVSQHIEGTVQLRATVAADGTVTAVAVISGDPILASAAEAAIRQWRFAPTVLDAVPVPTEQAITIAFSLSDKR